MKMIILVSVIALNACAEVPNVMPIHASGFITDPAAPILLQSDYVYDERAPLLRARGFYYPKP